MSIYTISNLGDDALANNFEIILPPTFPGAIDAFSTSIRAISVDIPEKAIYKYTVEYSTQRITKPGGKIDSPNEFSFTFRIDKYWNVYQGLRNWINLIGNPTTGVMSQDILPGGVSPIRVPISIITLDSSGAVTSVGWNFDGCWLSNLSGVSFDQSSGDPLEATATFDYITTIE